MSIRLVGRAFYADLPSHLKFLLVALCDEASDDGLGVCIGQARLARKVGSTDRAIRTKLGELDRLGWVRKLPEKHARYRTDQYEIAVERLADGPEEVSGAILAGPEAARVIHRKLSVLSTGSPLPPTRSTTRTTTPTNARARETDEQFKSFWNLYPRRTGGAIAAAREFERAIRDGATAEEILEGARRFAADPNLPTDRSKIPHASTWLHQGRWADDPLPERTDDPPRARTAFDRPL